jgi:uncharacterized membrane protein
MSWIIFTIGAVAAGALADIFRKYGSTINDPFLNNLVFQAAAFITAFVLYMIFSRKAIPEAHTNIMPYIIVGGLFVSLFTTFFFKALTLGPGVSTVAPIVRAGGIITVAILGLILFHEKLTWNLTAGIVLASVGIYLLFLNK